MSNKMIRPASILAAAAILAAPALAKADPSSVTVTNLPEIDLSGFQVLGLNNSGDLTGFFYVAFDHPPHAFSYTNGVLTDIGTLGGDVGQGNAINSSGHIVGESQPAGSFVSHAFLYDGTNMTDLGTLGGSYSSADLINELGQAGGSSLTGGDEATHAFLYSDGSMNDLGTLGGTYSVASALNNFGEVAGSSTLANNQQHAFFSDGASMTDLGTLGGPYSAAFGLNDSSVVIGESTINDSIIHPFVFANNTMTDLTGFGGSYATAMAINKHNQIMGLSSLPGDAVYHGFVFASGQLTDLGTLGGDNTFPYAQNNLGQVVGQSDTATEGAHAFLWQNGTLTDLNTLLPENSGWTLQFALYLNDAGRIVGVGDHSGLSEWFILDLASGNHPPVAVAGANQVVDCQTPVTLDGSHSSDPDGDALTFAWTCAGFLLGTNSTLSGMFAEGTNLVTLTVTDPSGASNQANVTVVVADTTAPVIVSGPALGVVSASLNCQGATPNVVSGIHATDNCTPASGLVITQSPPAGTPVSLGDHTIVVTVKDAAGNQVQGTLSFKVADTTAPVITSAPASLSVSVGANCQGVVPNVLGSVVAGDNCTAANQLVLRQSPTAGTVVSKGTYPVTVTVTDLAGNLSTRQLLLTVVDTTAPVISSVAASPNTIGSPNNKMVPVTVSVTATDNCGAPVSKIVSITCNESVAASAMQITGNLTASVLADRDNNGTGRVYTITVRTSDSSGNSSTATVTVTVPKGKK